MNELLKVAYKRELYADAKRTLKDWMVIAGEALILAAATAFTVMGMFSLLWMFLEAVK